VTINKDLLKKLRKLRGKGTVEATAEDLTQWSLGDQPPAAAESQPLNPS
jgi:hypothetical protein